MDSNQDNPFSKQNHPMNPNTARGRAAGKSAEQLRSEGIDAFGHPAQPERNGNIAGQRKSSGIGGSRGQSLAQLAQSIGDLEISNQDDLRQFCDAVRAVLHHLAVSTVMAAGQLKAGARAQARQTKSGMMTPGQRVRLEATLKLIGRDLNATAQSCAAGAGGAVKAWKRMESLLDELETANEKPNRPGGRGRSGFGII